MSVFINELTIMGYVGRNPELYYLPNRDAVTKLSVATSEKWIDSHTGEVKEETEWHTAVIFKSAAEVVYKHIKKGDLIWLRGKIKKRTWKDKSDQEHSNKELVVREMKFINQKDNPGKKSDQQLQDENLEQIEQPISYTD